MTVEPTASGFRPCASIPGKPWHCVFSLPLRERAIERRILDDGVSAWFPQEHFRRVNRQTVDRAVFPRYLFTQSDRIVIRDHGRQELGRLIVSPTTRKPLIVPALVMNSLFLQADEAGFLSNIKAVLKPGDEVRILAGPFVDFTAICEKATKDRVWLLLDALGRKVPIAFLRENVELAA